jgi:hypothetical protein
MRELHKDEPAFPRSYVADGHNGMSLRDYMAIHANVEDTQFSSIADLCEFVGEEARSNMEMPEMIALAAKAAAKLRYQFADAMLAERAK